MKDLILIGVGGGIGAICRFLLSRSVQLTFPFVFPLGTLVVNLLGSFFIGFLSILILNRFGAMGTELRALLLVGLLGGFTTFSTFSLESIELWENGAGIKLIFYLLLSVALGLFAAYGGLILGKKI
ncbi:fluoride efflux transporter CrcB [Candidatus Neptunichlamydia sp. REUL1]|uniref:fluoride efflux transporter CrcB n=1 Tax=Candidatus Neptunichlamydia sp. REUL1 TaxID=3064277 RepID=UPI00292D1C88|nr:fluoride efflux transporter CrcB [Candidatus Neptunochlamydia sp. REUL1]